VQTNATLVLTNDGEVDPGIPRLRHFEVYPTAVNASVFLPNVVNAKFCGFLLHHKEGAVSENILVRPALSLSEFMFPCIHTAKHSNTELVVYRSRIFT
jgi:hypothetical protein